MGTCNPRYQVLNEDYLASLERHYKTTFLPEMEKYGELVVTEYPDYDEVEQVLEEITRLDFSYEIDDPKKFEVSIASTTVLPLDVASLKAIPFVGRSIGFCC